MQPGYDPRTALIVVDLQNDFADPAGSLSVAGGGAIVPYVNEQIAAAVAAGAFVAYTQDWHPPSTPHFAKDGGRWPVHCVAGTWGAAFHPSLDAGAGPAVQKGVDGEDGYSGFTVRDPRDETPAPTELGRLLAARGIRRVVVCGLATDYCVRATALDAIAIGYPTSVLVEGVRAVDLQAGDGASALRELAEAGVELVQPAGRGGRGRLVSRLARLLLLGATGLGAAVATERWLGSLIAAGEGPDPVMKMAIAIDAPIEAVWEAVSDIERQPLWMHEMKSVRLLTPGPAGIGSRGEADVRIFLVGVVDLVEIDVYDPPVAFGIRHVGVFAGSGRIALEALDAGRTLVRWDERLVPPLFPNLGQLVQKPILGAIFQADLERLKEMVEARHAEAIGGAGADAG